MGIALPLWLQAALSNPFLTPGTGDLIFLTGSMRFPNGPALPAAEFLAADGRRVRVVVVRRVDLRPGRDKVVDAVEDLGRERDFGRLEQAVQLRGSPRPDEDGG